MKRIFWFLLTILAPISAFAYTFTNVLNPLPIRMGTDVSIDYLGDIFGVVDGVLHGSGSQIMGHMFGVLNSGALALGGIIIVYTMLVSTLNTAHEGEVLGKKWSSMWIPIRSTAGVALLLPKATGYSTIQIFMMWAIVQGVGLADSVWDSAISYLDAGGVIVQQSALAGMGVVTEAGNILRIQSCMYGIQYILTQARQEQLQKNGSTTIPIVPDFGATVTPITKAYNCPGVDSPCVQFPGDMSSYDSAYKSLEGICGTVTWAEPSTKHLNLPGVMAQTTQMIEFSQMKAVQQMILDLAGPAQQVVQARIKIGPDSGSKESVSKVLESKLLVGVAEDYEGIMAPLQRALVGGGGANPVNIAMLETAAIRGWVLAGSYYQILTSSNSMVQEALFPVPVAPGESFFSAHLGSDGGKLKDRLPANSAQQYASDVANMVIPTGSSLNLYIGQAIAYTAAYNTYHGATHLPIPPISGIGNQLGGDVLPVILGPIIAPIVKIFLAFAELATAQANNSNPVVLLAMIGNSLITLIAEVWIAGAVVAGVISGVLGAIPCVTLSSAVGDVVMWIMPLLWAIIGVLFVTASMMSYYVPLIPMLLFSFGAVGWYINVIEAMVAAPLVALGITHPEGHEILGRADPAILLLVNVFMRPSFMVIGLIAGIIMSYVSLWLFNQGFFTALTSYLVANVSGVAWLFVIPALLIVYTTVVIFLLNYSFSLINKIPDEVMEWLGSRGQQVGAEAQKGLGEVKGAMESGMGAMGKGMSDTSQAAGQRADKLASGAASGGGGGGGDSLNVGNDSGGGDSTGAVTESAVAAAAIGPE